MRYDSYRLFRELFPPPLREEIFLAPYHLPHRFYHTQQHIDDNLKFLKDEELIIANLFHDICYDPRLDNNEERSAALFLKHATHCDAANRIADIILSTKEHTADNDLVRAEMHDLWFCEDIDKIKTIEKNIFKEFQCYSISDFIEGRTSFLQNNAIEKYFAIAKTTFHYNVGVYAGSFNPIHIGHQAIIERAEAIFDKVIIAQGVNPEKEPPVSLENILPFHEVTSYPGLLTDYINKLESSHPASFTLIRGLRNGADLSYETNQLEFMLKMKPDLKVVFIPCDKTREHISSSALRSLMKFNAKEAERYFIKKYNYEA